MFNAEVGEPELQVGPVIDDAGDVVESAAQLKAAAAAAGEAAAKPEAEFTYSGPAEGGQVVESKPKQKQQGKKIGRNQPCYCGSGKKYKVCHGRSS